MFGILVAGHCDVRVRLCCMFTSNEENYKSSKPHEAVNEQNWWKLRPTLRDEEESKICLATNVQFELMTGHAVVQNPTECLSSSKATIEKLSSDGFQPEGVVQTFIVNGPSKLAVEMPPIFAPTVVSLVKNGTERRRPCRNDPPGFNQCKWNFSERLRLVRRHWTNRGMAKQL